MNSVTHLPVSNPRRRVAPPDALKRLEGAARDLQEIAQEHDWDRDGIREVAARILRTVEDMRAAEMGAS
ncbi:hypothetical protein [Azospirillum brasilense]|uniref:hypothetical protein n=1 Tax=Azospirillum brasilense TaxID=192 RepID=UPI000E6A7F2B|nr:hypothetical protein [Azospirillum brasilense]NUB28530.1 hypothetical protein [Azospirillum brasilense]NUB35697.1 hypothetical protein [Azospirillum brasilense]RIV96731.1 hypothetical protein D2T81_30750 [Azospirillum brasilense]